MIFVETFEEILVEVAELPLLRIWLQDLYQFGNGEHHYKTVGWIQISGYDFIDVYLLFGWRLFLIVNSSDNIAVIIFEQDLLLAG